MADMSALMDQLNVELQRATEVLDELGLAVSAEVPLSDGKLLGFWKMDTVWALYVRAGDSERQLLLGLSRKLRLEAAHKLTELREALWDASADQTRLVEGAIKAVRAFNLTRSVP